MTRGRRSVLKGIGAGTAVLIGGAGIGSAQGDEAAIRVAHGSPDAPNVDVYVDGSEAVSDLAFRGVTPYLEIASGEHEIEVTVASDSGKGKTVFGPATVDLENEDWTAVARGEVTSDDTKFTVSLFQDTNGANIGEDETRVRAIHASPDAPDVDVVADSDDGDSSEIVVFDDVAYPESSGYAVVPSGTYDEIEVVDEDTSGEDTEPEADALQDVTLDGRSTYTVFAFGYLTPDDEPADEAFALKAVKDRGAPPRGP